MKIGIIGSGHVGSTLTRRLQGLGHDVTVTNSRGPRSLTGLAEETGATAGTVADATRDADLVIIAVPMRAVPELPADEFRGKIVADANNYYPTRDGDIVDIADGTVASSRWVAQQLPETRVVKAFNNIHAAHLGNAGRAAGAANRIALPVASDDNDAKQTVMVLIDQLGFDPVDAGPLDQSWRQQPDTPVFGTDRNAGGVRDGLASASQ